MFCGIFYIDRRVKAKRRILVHVQAIRFQRTLQPHRMMIKPRIQLPGRVIERPVPAQIRGQQRRDEGMSPCHIVPQVQPRSKERESGGIESGKRFGRLKAIRPVYQWITNAENVSRARKAKTGKDVTDQYRRPEEKAKKTRRAKS